MSMARPGIDLREATQITTPTVAGPAPTATGPASDQARPDELVVQFDTDKTTFEIGQQLADELNRVTNDARCGQSRDACAAPIREVLERAAAGGKYFERRAVQGKYESRQYAEVSAAVLGLSYLAYKLFNEPKPQPVPRPLIPTTWNTSQPVGEHHPVAVAVSIAEFDPSRSGTSVTTSSSPVRDRFVFIQTAIATNRKACSTLQSQIEAIATSKPVIPNLSSFDLPVPLPGYFKVALSREQEAQVKLLDGVRTIIGPLGKPIKQSQQEFEAGAEHKHHSEDAAHTYFNQSMRSSKRELVERGERSIGTNSQCHAFASWPPGLQDPPRKYVFQDLQGGGYPIYLLDEGFDLSHNEFADLRGDYGEQTPIASGQTLSKELRWFNGEAAELNPERSLKTDRTVSGEENPNTHGTKTLSILAGRTVGLLPKSRPILVKYMYGDGYESSLRRILEHVILSKPAVSPMVVITVTYPMWEWKDGKPPVNQEEWSADHCEWAKEIGDNIQLLIAQGATVLLSGANERSVSPLMSEVIALGPSVHKDRCMLQHRIQVPWVAGAHIVTMANPLNGEWLNPYPLWPGSRQFVGAGMCNVVNEGKIELNTGCSIAAPWVAAVLVTIEQKHLESNKPEKSLVDQAAALHMRAVDLQYKRAGSKEGSPEALWNGLVSLDDRTKGPKKNKALSIMLERKDVQSDDYHWRFYETVQGQTGGCLTQMTSVFEAPVFHGAILPLPPLPSGEYDFKIWGRSCKFQGNGNNPGRLLCDGTEYGCSQASSSSKIQACPDGKDQREGAYCEFDSDGPATVPSFKPGTCTFRMWQTFVYPKFTKDTVQMRFEGIKDADGKDIGGAWGDKDGSAVKNGQVIKIDSKLPEPLLITAEPFDHKPVDVENYKNSKHFTFAYGQQRWPEFMEKPVTSIPWKQSCKTEYTSIIGTGYRLLYDCFFSC